MQNIDDEGKIVDIKGTISSFIEEEPKVLTQEEAIKAYNGEKSYMKNKKKSSSSDSDANDENSEDEEHLKRVKKQLLESLDRVNKLEKTIFEEKMKKNIKNIKISDNVRHKDLTKENNLEIDKNKQKIIEQMRENVNSNKERSRGE